MPLKSLVRALSLLFLVISFSGAAADAEPAAPSAKTYRVGFSQIIDHPAINTVRQGFFDGLRDGGFVEGRNLVLDYQNAQGDVANARNIAEKFIAGGVDLLVACGTPNVLATIKVARGGRIPTVFGCVTDPVSSGILAVPDQPTGTNVTGLYGTLPAAELFDLIARILPGAKSFGTIYNSGDANSVRGNSIARKLAEERGLTWIEAHITSSAEVKTAAQSLIGRVDVLYLVEDNMLASAFDAVVKAARDTPLFSLDTTSVERGAVASYGIDHYKMGYEWARQVAVPVLKGADPASLVPVPYKVHELYLNTAAAARDKLTLPPALLQSARHIYEK